MHIWLAGSLLLLLGFSPAAVSRLLAVTPLVAESRLRLHSSWASVLMAPSSGHRLHSSRLWTQAPYLGCTDLVALRHVGSSWTRDRTCVSRIGRQILYH